MIDPLTIAGAVCVPAFTAAGLLALFWHDVQGFRSPWRF